MGALCLFLGFGVLACGDDAPDPDPDGGLVGDAGPEDTRTFLELCAQPELYCSRLYECAEPERLDEDQLFFGHTDEGTCVEAQREVTGLLCTVLNESLEAGRLTFDRPKLAACADHMEALACDEYVHADPATHAPCQGSPFLAPNVPLGGECAQDAECIAPANLCTATPGALGECAVAPLEGEACVADRCATGLRCDGGFCVVPEGAICSNDFDCLDGEWCDQPGNDYRVEFENPELEGVCTARLTAAAHGEDVGACVEGLYCDDTNGADGDGFRLPGHCVEPRESGGACNEPADCLSFDCTDAGTCA